MSFIIILSFAFLAGLFGGMGMGGGTILIPALTLISGIEQHAAQAANLIAFLPMSLISLKIHSGNGLLKTQGSLLIIIPAVALSVSGAFAAAYMPSELLSKLFGGFLVALACKQTADIIPQVKAYFKNK